MIQGLGVAVPDPAPVVDDAVQVPVRCDVVTYGHGVGQVEKQGGDGTVTQDRVDRGDGQDGDVGHADTLGRLRIVFNKLA